MTTLYRPVLIETDDQPMATFPPGTIATHPDQGPVERCSCSRWESDGPDRYDSDMVGWTALVPVEAEVETHSIQTRGQVTPEWRTRYVTPWEEA